MTSAPMSAKIMEQNGPATIWVASNTLIPSRGKGSLSPAWVIETPRSPHAGRIFASILHCGRSYAVFDVAPSASQHVRHSLPHNNYMESELKARGVSHIAICVADLDKSLEFYRDILGLTVKLHTTQEMERRPGAESAEMYQCPRKARTVANIYFDDPASPQPFLVLTSHPGDEVGGEPIKLDQKGISHLSFEVENVKAHAEELIAKGVPLAGTMEDFTSASGNVRTIFVYDPDGILVQFDEGPPAN
ncbi:MAG: VOC family protein [SAR202 cluster bacterium]|nr:VOC family protein [SAR202 cluster bacterium]MQG10369.1 VOC family protein [SAR202 cluster bacterium]